MRSLVDLSAGLRPVAALVAHAGGELQEVETEAEAAAPASPLGALVWRPALRKRNALVYATVRSWRAATRERDLVAFKRLKRDLDSAGAAATVAAIAGELAAFAGLLLGTGGPGLSVAYVAPGHSRRPDCLSQRLAARVAAALGAQYVQAFADRFVSGCSHPKEFKRLPPLQVLARPAGPVVLVDDLASSGWHLEEAAGVLRQTAPLVLALAWIGGTVGAVGG